MTHVKLKSIALAVTFVLAAAGCGGGSGDKDTSRGTTVAGEDGAPSVTVTPGDGSAGVRPDSRVAVSVGNGTLSQVSVRSGGASVAGGFSAGRTGWKAKRGLKPGASYEVTASATGKGGKTTTVTSRFRTTKGDGTLAIADITPMSDRSETIGVGMPIIVRFNRAVTDRAAVERALEVKAQKPVEGAWRWVASNQAVYRTKRYWPAHQKVRFTARLTGVAAGRNVYGAADVTRRFAIGAAQISTVDTRTHRLVMRRDGRVVRNFPISAGRGGGPIKNGVDTFLTTTGTHLVMEKKLVETMSSRWMGVDPKDKAHGGYEEKIPYAVRISSSGEYVHSMAATRSAQGVRNVSHGCVNSPPEEARWFYANAHRGDVVTVTGTARGLSWTNGWSFWQLSWNAWRAKG
ncbi:L,D-transpeptidase [Actinomadura barringtoniae]|uniref:L,D-transpeptidase n=1 Tax=Actinomadura barringtoniae TaxID=1427535 RepID=UPI0027DDA7EB|nr:Ig-like domain-containing protein [Actinomadura barringtoniae]